MAIEQITPSSTSPIKHTQGGEIPDTTPQGTLLRRLKADSSVLKYGITRTPRIYWILGGLVGILATSYLYFSRKKSAQ